MSYSSIFPFKHSGPDLLDCCNGLLLFVQRPKPQFYVCNPTIRQCVPVPLPPPSVHLSSLYASLAFDPCESIHYRVIVLSITTQPQCLHIFYSQSGAWMTHEVHIELPSSGKCFQLIRHSVYLKGILYRLSLLNKVIFFDLNRLTIRVINNPCKTPPPQPGCIAVSNGLLSYVKREKDYVCVWLLDDPNEPNEWSLKYKLCFDNLLDCVLEKKMGGILVWLHPCGFHPTEDILFMSSASSILAYHIGIGRIQEVRSFSFLGEVSGGYFFPVFMHRNTFVTLKNWCRGTTTEINNYEEVHDNWCYVEQ
ncbi:uncharacterized protein LOC110700963 isoform X2 [Chenopodium quinoa]|uniref:uncharacterized protein LOC110700963 isoform X2 n=1 Tax=Chenopodium quinoa TaxID=63459 RepID=UPI000B772D8A|nr:uncharacterized protein LOC110700963 isoform X2 [Chenopodium quinoa]